MINQLDPARKGMPWVMMTAEEQQLLRDAPDGSVKVLCSNGDWNIDYITEPDGFRSFWTYWKRPEKTREEIHAEHVANGLVFIGDADCDPCVFDSPERCQCAYGHGPHCSGGHWEKAPKPAEPAVKDCVIDWDGESPVVNTPAGYSCHITIYAIGWTEGGWALKEFVYENGKTHSQSIKWFEERLERAVSARFVELEVK